MTNTSLQAMDGRLLAPVDPLYPIRVVILELWDSGWRRTCIFECTTLAEADEAGMEMCTEPYPDGVSAMHYYIGEVA